MVDAKNELYRQYKTAEDYINAGLIRTWVPEERIQRTRREWMLRFLDDLGHPEQAFPAVHIAGTSGKSSTSVLLAEVLRAAGYKVGLHITPYLQVATEKLWYDGRYASGAEFIDLIEWIKPICERRRSPEVPLHGLASVGICLEYFRRKKVDIAVIETGVGGRNDITNVLKTCLAMITPLGLDHTKTLGETIESIAWHKAGILQPEKPTVVFQGPGADVIQAEADRIGAQIFWVNPKEKMPTFTSPMAGKFQQLNVMMTAAAATVLNRHEWRIDRAALQKGVEQARIPGRLEILQEHPQVIIDGAHNHQKLQNLWREFSSREPILVFGMLQSKLKPNILELLQSKKNRLIFTLPNVYGKEAFDPRELLSWFDTGRAVFEPVPEKALQLALDTAQTADTVLVAGSLYLAGNIREQYFPAREILCGRTSWPDVG